MILRISKSVVCDDGYPWNKSGVLVRKSPTMMTQSPGGLMIQRGSPTLSVIFFLLPWKWMNPLPWKLLEVRGSAWHGSSWKRRGSAMEARGSRMEVKIGFMEADGTSWNQNPTSMEFLT